MQKESLSFFMVNGFHSFLSADDEYLAFCHNKKIGKKPFIVFQLIDRLEDTEKFWVKENEFFYTFKSLLKAYPILSGKRKLRTMSKQRVYLTRQK